MTDVSDEFRRLYTETLFRECSLDWQYTTLPAWFKGTLVDRVALAHAFDRISREFDAELAAIPTAENFTNKRVKLLCPRCGGTACLAITPFWELKIG